MPFALGLAAEKNPTHALRSHASGNTLSASQWRTPCANHARGRQARTLGLSIFASAPLCHSLPSQGAQLSPNKFIQAKS